MISDTLADAIAEIRQYQDELPNVYAELRPQIDAVTAHMDLVRSILDAPPTPGRKRRARAAGPPEVRHTACRHCGQDIEGIAPYRIGQWRDRGNNTHCPTPTGRVLHRPI